MNLHDKLQLAYSKIAAAERVLIVGHTSPDADAIASIGAMIEIAQSLGLGFYAFADKKVDGAYSFIPHEDLIRSEEPDDLRVFDVILVLDCGSISRTGLEVRLRNLIKANGDGRLETRPYIIELDHHQPSESYADLELRLPDKASTTEIIYHLLKANNIEVNRTLANCILIGLMTDTGHFLHANSSREALAVSSEMLLRGASLPRIIDHTVNNKSFASLKVWGRAIDNMHLDSETGFAFSALTAQELDELMPEEYSSSGADLFGDIVSFLSTLSGVKVALLLREEKGRVKGSLRTNDDIIDVASIAQHWGGGGHKKAAGFSVSGRLLKKDKGWGIIK